MSLPNNLAAMFVILACGCSHTTSFERRLQSEVEAARVSELATTDTAQCKRDGGEILGVGMFGLPACVVPYADSGKTCNDKADCLGRCNALPQSKTGDEGVAGKCENDAYDSSGCFSELKSGVVTERRCYH